MKTSTAVLITVVLASVSPLHAQSGNLDERLKALASLSKPDASKPDPEYRLGAADLIEIAVFGVDTFHHTVRINASGVVKLPLLEPVMAAGLTPGELEQKLASLLEKDVIKNPQVSVFVKEYRSQPVYVLGAVRNPGQYQISSQLRIVDVIAMAGGLQATAGDDAVIQRPSPDGGEQKIAVNLRELLEKGDSSLNVIVHGSDVVHIGERAAQTVYIVGDINRAGAFPIPPKQGLRVSQVFAWAGGPMKTALLSKGILVRYGDKGERQQLPVNFDEILKGKKEDFVVRADDVIFVPSSKVKDFGYSLLAGLPGLVATLPYRIP